MTPDTGFEALRGRDTYQTSLAYWLGLIACKTWPPSAGAEALHADLSYQYDIEEQAGYTGTLFPTDAEWRKVFTPIAPVQLAASWCPTPYAIEVLGAPDWLDLEVSEGSRAVATAWLSSRLEAVRAAHLASTAPADHHRFLNLLTVAAMRGLERRRGLLLVACPGWSYEHGHVFDRATQGHMRHAHFAVIDRHPEPKGAA